MKEEEFVLTMADVQKLALTAEEVEGLVSFEEEVKEEIELAFMGIPDRIVCDIGKRFVWCVSRIIIEIVKKLCGDRNYRERICYACKHRRIDLLINLICPIVVRTLHCIPCMRPVVVYLCPILIRSLFWTICRICECL